MGMKAKSKGSDGHKLKMMEKKRRRDELSEWMRDNPRAPGQRIYITQKVVQPVPVDSDAKIVMTPAGPALESFCSPVAMGL